MPLHKDKWKSLDYLRDTTYWIDRDRISYKDPKIGFKICEETGFVTYDERPGIEEHYRNTYRKNVQAGNLITCNRKIEYHKRFLGDFLSSFYKKEWIRVMDFGCAFGANLHWLNTHGLVKKAKGYELTDGFVNFGRTIYGLDIEQAKEPSDAPGSFDLVILYHVLEHVPDPVLLLKQLRETMADDGRLYISVPVWFESCEEPAGSQTSDFENLYHIDHIQVFSRNSIRNAIQLGGFEIEKENDQVYGHTFLLKKSDKKPKLVYDDPAKIISILEDQKKAMELLGKDPEAAYTVYPDFPDAYVLHVVKIQSDFAKMKEVLQLGLTRCTSHFKLLQQLGILHMQWDGDTKISGHTNHVQFAKECFEKCQALRPNNEGSLWYLGLIAFLYEKNPGVAIENWKEIVRINPSRYTEIWQWIGKAAAG